MAAAHGFKPVFGHTEPRRGAEWRGKSALVTFALFESDPPSGGTLSGRNRRNGYVLGITGSPARPPSRASPHRLNAGHQVDRCRLAGRHRRQASSHSLIAGRQVDRCRLSDNPPHMDPRASGT
ncbi:hypothetical protein CDH05_09740 [Pseudomonas lactis]|nr:hypothetical protein CDH05_09740 [Pseudomonas lactis]